MKNAIIAFKPREAIIDTDYLKKALNVFEDNNMQVDRLEILSYNDDLAFIRSVKEFKDTIDNLIVINSDCVSFNVKETIAKIFDTTLIENENAMRFLQAVINQTGKEFSVDNAMLPENSTLIPNISGAYQGFLIDEEDFTLSVLPSTINEFSITCGKYVIPYIENKFNIKTKKLTLKYIDDGNVLVKTLSDASSLCSGFSFNITQSFGDYTINLIFTNEQINDSANAVRYIVSNLKGDIYAEFDTTLDKRLFDLLKLKNIKLSVAESFTGGRVASSLVQNSGISDYFIEGLVCYSNHSKMERLGVRAEDLTRSGAVSSVVAYQMAAGLLRNTGCDLAIATTGIAGPNSDNTSKPVGLCFIAIGTKEGVHTYKYNLSGDREQITEHAKNLALGQAIKILKKK